MTKPTTSPSSKRADRIFAWATICILAAPAGVVLSGVSTIFLYAGHTFEANASLSSRHYRHYNDCTPSRTRSLPRQEAAFAGHRAESRSEHRAAGRTGHRAESRAGHRADNRAGHRADNRAGHRADNRAGHRADNRAGHRAGIRAEHRAERRTEYRAERAAMTEHSALTLRRAADQPDDR